MTPALIVADACAPVLATLKTQLPSATLLHGKRGVGLNTIASVIAGQSAERVYPVTKKGDEDAVNGSISIETIRLLYTSVRTGGKRRVVIIDDADRMSRGAQNAFLKLLEEPPRGIHFLLTSHNPESILKTIRSRVANVHIPLAAKAKTDDLIASKNALDQRTEAQVKFLAAGLPAEAQRLLADETYRADSIAVMTDARTCLTISDTYQRIGIIAKYSGSRESAIRFVDASILVLRHILSTEHASSYAAMSQRLLTTYEQLHKNTNPKLQLLRFVVQ